MVRTEKYLSQHHIIIIVMVLIVHHLRGRKGAHHMSVRRQEAKPLWLMVVSSSTAKRIANEW
jgi:hypothetical protein